MSTSLPSLLTDFATVVLASRLHKLLPIVAFLVIYRLYIPEIAPRYLHFPSASYWQLPRKECISQKRATAGPDTDKEIRTQTSLRLYEAVLGRPRPLTRNRAPLRLIPRVGRPPTSDMLAMPTTTIGYDPHLAGKSLANRWRHG